MPATTPLRGYPYQTINDAPAGHLLGEDLARAIDTDMAAQVAAIAALDGRLDELDGSWDSNPPVWSSSGTQPAIGNGALEGLRIKAGRFVKYVGRMTAGTTTTFGTGNYNIAAPFTARVVNGDADIYLGAFLALDGAASYVGLTRMDGANLLRFHVAGSTSQVGPTVPFTFGNGDRFIWSIIYEAAS